MTVNSKTYKSKWGLIGTLALFIVVVDLGLGYEEDFIIPVEGASPKDWNHNTFWYEPWGNSGVHKGIDIFARRGTAALAAVSGVVVYRGELKLGGKALMILDPKWRLHYYAHLDSIAVRPGDWVRQGSTVGEVGNTGNARRRPVHLHYAMMSLIPYPHR
ncbi:MAG: M23 family metallopeptidase, partial [Gammaproteobacteria bacterium]